MKTQSIIFSALLLLGTGVATTSCEDLLDAENKLVTTDFAPQDTVYQYNGIIHAMQGVVDQSILLGELRADLVTVNAAASTDLQQLGANNVSTDNAYNNPASFYNVINNCNIYLHYVDSTRLSKGESYFEREIISVKTFRAWCYLELAKIYGSVPFVTEPVLESNAAKQIVESGERKNMEEICTYFIEDLLPYAFKDRNYDLVPHYKLADNNLVYAAIPLRVMLGDLYLYRSAFTQSRSDAKEAVRFLHDYLTFTNEELATDGEQKSWNSADFRGFSTATTSSNYITRIPMDSISYYGGTYSELRSVFNSTPGNNYYAAVTPSDRLLSISNSQPYCYWDAEQTSNQDTIVGHPTVDEIKSSGAIGMSNSGLSDDEAARRLYGDLRYSLFYNTNSVSDQYHAEYSTQRQGITKYLGASSSMASNDERLSTVTLIRPLTVYYHLCEALNHAGYPETAFALLKYGLSNTVINDTTKVSSSERLGLKSITSYGFSSDAADWDEDIFYTADRFANKNSTISVNSSKTLLYSGRQMALAAYGSGDVQCNPNFYLPTDSTGLQEVPVDTLSAKIAAFNPVTHEDSVAYNELCAQYLDLCDSIDAVKAANAKWLASETVKVPRMEAVDSMLIDQYALEFAYEGTRYYDLMRYSKYWGKNYLGEAVAKRGGSNTITESNGWYLTLPKE